MKILFKLRFKANKKTLAFCWNCYVSLLIALNKIRTLKECFYFWHLMWVTSWFDFGCFNYGFTCKAPHMTTRTENLLRSKQSNIFQSSDFLLTFSHFRLQAISMYMIFCLSKLIVVYSFQTLFGAAHEWRIKKNHNQNP